jgi:hypothetical protein
MDQIPLLNVMQLTPPRQFDLNQENVNSLVGLGRLSTPKSRRSQRSISRERWTSSLKDPKSLFREVSTPVKQLGNANPQKVFKELRNSTPKPSKKKSGDIQEVKREEFGNLTQKFAGMAANTLGPEKANEFLGGIGDQWAQLNPKPNVSGNKENQRYFIYYLKGKRSRSQKRNTN